MPGFGDMTDNVARQVERAGARVSEALFEPVVRLGVTGLSRAGKTVFITSLVANLMDRGRMAQLRGAATGAIRAAYLEPQPDDTVPRFDYESHLAAVSGPEPRWPASTRHVSQLRLSFRVQPTGLLAGLSGPRKVHLDIVDYPGEWLLDLGLLDMSYGAWSARVIARARARGDMARGFLSVLERTDPEAAFTQESAQELAGAYTAWLHAARDAGLAYCTPGRFLLPGEMEGSPVLTFAPLERTGGTGRSGCDSLGFEMERRYEVYKKRIVKPFLRDHFARIDRQVVLVDMLGAIHDGPRAVAELGDAMTDILRAFRPGRNSWLSGILGKRVERILFAATKADHLHHSQHPQLAVIMEALLRGARDRADFKGATTAAMSIAAMRATVEEMREHGGKTVGCVRGRLQESTHYGAFFPGTLPENPAELLGAARGGAQAWPDAEYRAMDFAPAGLRPRPGEGPAHIRLDRAAEFLFGDRLR